MLRGALWHDRHVLVDRELEVATLREHLERGISTVVLGEAGVGKTTLLRAAVEDLGGPVLEGGALAALQWMPYLPITRAIGSTPPAGDHEEVCAWIARRIEAGVLVLDDLQWADQDTLSVLALLASRVRVLAGIRTGDPGTAAALKSIDGSGFAPLRLQSLNPEQIEQLIRSRQPAIGQAALRKLVESCRGNPQLATQLVDGDGCSALFRLTLGARIRRLSPAGRSALAILGLISRPAERELLDNGFDELIEAGLAFSEGPVVSALHKLVGEVAVGQLDSDERRLLHARIARWTRDPGEAARHLAAAGQQPEAYAKAIVAAVLARNAADRADYVAIAAASAPKAEREHLQLQAARELEALGDFPRAASLLSDVESRSPATRAEVALQLAIVRRRLNQLAAARAEVVKGLDLAAGTNGPLEVQLRVEEARLHQLSGDVARGMQLAEEAWRLARATGMGEAAARCVLGEARLLSLSRDCLDDLKAALDAAQETGDTTVECEAAARLVRALQRFGEPEGAHELARHMVARSHSHHLREWEAIFRYLRCHLDFCRHALPASTLSELEHLLDEYVLGVYRAGATALLATALAHAGRLTEARSRLADGFAETSRERQRMSLLLAQAEIEWLGRHPDAALAAVEKLKAISAPGCEHLLALGAIIEGWASVELDRSPQGLSTAVPFPALEGAVVESAALRRVQEPDGLLEAESLFQKAASVWSRHMATAEVRCLWAAAEAARQAGAKDRALNRLETAERRARSLGMVGLLDRIASSLQKAGPPVATSAVALPLRQPERGGLTRREREVLRLVGAGLSSRDIAALLGIAPSTVEAQIRSGMRKLGAATRVQAATLVLFRREDALISEDALPPT